jgi:hypothetical protein
MRWISIGLVGGLTVVALAPEMGPLVDGLREDALAHEAGRYADRIERPERRHAAGWRSGYASPPCSVDQSGMG